MGAERVVVVKRETLLEGLLRRHATASQVKYHLESRGQSHQTVQQAHDTYYATLTHARGQLKEFRTQLLDKDHLGTYTFGERDIVVVLGDDGLLVNVAKYTDGQPIISVNADPERFDGLLASCNVDKVKEMLEETVEGKVHFECLTMAEAQLGDGQRLHALNDLFIGRADHCSARYTLSYAGSSERQSSSGIIISTGTGSTGWLRSVIVGSIGIAGKVLDLDLNNTSSHFPKDARHLYFAVREPFPSKITGTDLIFGPIKENDPLVIHSHMPERGVIFSDGIQKDYLEFNAGTTVKVYPAAKVARLVRRSYR